MKTGIKVYDAMTNRPVTAPETSTAREIACLMKDERVGSILISQNSTIKGIVTDEDLIHRVLAAGADADKHTAKDIMTAELVTVEPKMDIFDAMMLMRDADLRHLPVVENRKILGLLTAKDILKIEPQLFDLIVEKIELREEHRKPITEKTAEEGICELCNNYTEALLDIDGSKVCPDCKDKL